MPKREQAAKTPEPASFETQIASLERIVRELERGDLPLERSLELFEQGVRLSRECQERLNGAERRIEVLLREPDGRLSVGPFGGDELDIEGGADEATDDDENVF